MLLNDIKSIIRSVSLAMDLSDGGDVGLGNIRRSCSLEQRE